MSGPGGADESRVGGPHPRRRRYSHRKAVTAKATPTLDSGGPQASHRQAGRAEGARDGSREVLRERGGEAGPTRGREREHRGQEPDTAASGLGPRRPGPAQTHGTRAVGKPSHDLAALCWDGRKALGRQHSERGKRGPAARREFTPRRLCPSPSRDWRGTAPSAGRTDDRALRPQGDGKQRTLARRARQVPGVSVTRRGARPRPSPGRGLRQHPGPRKVPPPRPTRRPRGHLVRKALRFQNKRSRVCPDPRRPARGLHLPADAAGPAGGGRAETKRS